MKDNEGKQERRYPFNLLLVSHLHAYTSYSNAKARSQLPSRPQRPYDWWFVFCES